jgi:1,4-dihydroxy-2-naphthoate octaprenyltransferase
VSTYSKFSFKAAKELAAPHTWVASVGPVAVGGALVIATGAYAHLGFDARALAVWLCMLGCAVLLQAATNTLNDYKDFVAGTDTAQTIIDETDASIVYNRIDPKSALHFAIGLMVAAAVLGLAVVALSQPWVLLLGLIGAAVSVFYSMGPKPLSYLPLGELASGVVMGVIITLATYYAITLTFNFTVLATLVAPTVIIGVINQVNNTCDIERDIDAGRRTLPVLIGRQRSIQMITALLLFVSIWMILVLALSRLYAGIPFVLLGVLVAWPQLNVLRTGCYDLQQRPRMMGSVTLLCRRYFSAWTLALATGGLVNGIFYA